MDRVAALADQQRRDLFEATATARGVHPAIIEKDFWVCWVLRRLFTSPQLKDRLVFKGGTSLSKVYRLIDRFSEDIDLVLDWRLLGYGDQEPWDAQASNTQRDRFNKKVNDDAAAYLAGTLQPQLVELFTDVPGVVPAVSADDPMAIDITYPAAFDLDALRPQVKLEIGPLASWVPSAPHVITPYAAEAYGHVFDDPRCPVVATTAERTFWEKATILHQQAHREKPIAANYSRHYYDVHRLAASPVKDAALSDRSLLADVVAFKQRFYPSAGARYEEAKPGTFRLVPTEAGRRALEADYRAMRQMIFGEAPAWSDILTSLEELEREINSLEEAGAQP